MLCKKESFLSLFFISRIFDKDDDGLISVEELRHIMLSFGEKMSEKELDEMISEANCDKDGHIDYEDFVLVLCNDGKKAGTSHSTASAARTKKNRKNKSKSKTATLMSTSLTVQSSKAAPAASSSAMTSSTSSSALRTNVIIPISFPLSIKSISVSHCFYFRIALAG